MDIPETDEFLTIASPSQSLYKEKGSKFIGLAYPVTLEVEIKNILTNLRKEYFDARHHCYAYQLGLGGNQYRANDDGEPNHSAGDPILGQIRSAKLTDILVVVIRYFGGTKLGVSGLIQAYKTAAHDAIAVAEIIRKTEMVTMQLQFDFLQMNAVMQLVKENKLEILEQDFGTFCTFKVAVRGSLTSIVAAKLSKLEGVNIL